MAKSTLRLALFLSLQLLVISNARSLSDSSDTDDASVFFLPLEEPPEPETTAAAIVLPSEKPHSSALDSDTTKSESTANMADRNEGSDECVPHAVPFTKVSFHRIGRFRLPTHRLMYRHRHRLVPMVRSRLGQRLFDDNMMMSRERWGFSRGTHSWRKNIGGRRPVRVYFLQKPSFELPQNGMKFKSPYDHVPEMEVGYDSQSHPQGHDDSHHQHDNEKVNGYGGLLMKIRKFLTQF